MRLKMVSGRPLDADVAKTVMGWDEIEWRPTNFRGAPNEPFGVRPGTKPLPRTDQPSKLPVPAYSSNRELANEIIDRIESLGHGRILVGQQKPDGTYSAYLDTEQEPEDWTGNGDRAESAICAAALRVIETSSK